ncbi:MAG: hypothetical protein ACE5HQ_12915 [Gemmatimonadota bacterium]
MGSSPTHLFVSRLALAGWAALLLGACGSAQGPASRDGSTQLVVLGVVQTTAGAAVPGATIDLQAFVDSCDGVLLANAIVSSNSAGTYRHRLVTFGATTPACLRVFAEAPEGAPLRGVTVADVFATFRGPGEPADTVVVELTLPPRSP